MGPGNRPRRLSAPDSRVGRARRPATGVPEEWPYRGGNALDRTRLTGHLALVNLLIRFVLQADDSAAVHSGRFGSVPVLFAGKTSLKTRPLRVGLQGSRERSVVNTC